MIIEIREVVNAGHYGYKVSRQIGDPRWWSIWQFFAVAWVILGDWFDGRWWRTR